MRRLVLVIALLLSLALAWYFGRNVREAGGASSEQSRAVISAASGTTQPGAIDLVTETTPERLSAAIPRAMEAAR